VGTETARVGSHDASSDAVETSWLAWPMGFLATLLLRDCAHLLGVTCRSHDKQALGKQGRPLTLAAQCWPARPQTRNGREGQAHSRFAGCGSAIRLQWGWNWVDHPRSRFTQSGVPEGCQASSIRSGQGARQPAKLPAVPGMVAAAGRSRQPAFSDSRSDGRANQGAHAPCPPNSPVPHHFHHTVQREAIACRSRCPFVTVEIAGKGISAMPPRLRCAGTMEEFNPGRTAFWVKQQSLMCSLLVHALCEDCIFDLIGQAPGRKVKLPHTSLTCQIGSVDALGCSQRARESSKRWQSTCLIWDCPPRSGESPSRRLRGPPIACELAATLPLTRHFALHARGCNPRQNAIPSHPALIMGQDGAAHGTPTWGGLPRVATG
jgi:hypothetical protein